MLDVKKAVEQQLPGYGAAQQAFAAASPPVNQAQVLGAMQDVLKQPLGVGERVTPFMTAMGRGENALIKKATGDARFGDLNSILTPAQMKVVNGIAGELETNAKIANQTQAGADAMNKILKANESKFRLPSFLDVKVTLTNQMIDLLKQKMSANVLKELEKGFQSAKSFEELMGKVPASERIAVLKALGQAYNTLSPAKINAWTQSVNALAPENQNNLGND